MVTHRTDPAAPGRLFPSITWDHGWILSLQADAAGYQCFPKEHFGTLEEYETVEARLDGPFMAPVDATTLDLPQSVLDKFPALEVGGGSSIGGYLTWDDVEAIKKAIVFASLQPNAGVPRGNIGWSGTRVFHGTSAEHSQDIAANGINIGKSHHGYFGQAFYVADDKELAISNYAEFSDGDDAGSVLEFEIAEGARILDLRNAKDGDEWNASGITQLLGRDDLAMRARNMGIDGVYDRSVGGLAIYNANVLGKPVAVHGLDDVEPDSGPKF